MLDNHDSKATGMSRNVASFFSYFLFFISGIIILLIEQDKSVRFHAIQSILFSILFGFLLYVFSSQYFFFPIILIRWVILVGGIALWIVLMLKAYGQQEEWKLPIIGRLASKIAQRL